MAGASVELIGRRARDYFDFLPQPRRKRVIDRIRRWYLHHFPSLGEDCAQEACARLLASAIDLKTGPEPMTTPSSEWYDADSYEAVTCIACRQLHLVNSATSEVLGEND